MLHFVKAVYRRRSDYDNNSVSCDDDYQDDCGDDDEGVISRAELTLVCSTAACVREGEGESEQMVVTESGFIH